MVFLVVGIPEAQRYQGRALNHWRHFFSNLSITLQLAHQDPPPPRKAADECRPAFNHRNSRSMDEKDWEREFDSRTSGSVAHTSNAAGARDTKLALHSHGSDPGSSVDRTRQGQVQHRSMASGHGLVPSASLLAAGTVAAESCLGLPLTAGEDADAGAGSGVMIGTSHVLYRVTSRIAVDRYVFAEMP